MTFFGFLSVYDYLTFLVDINFTIYSLAQKKFKFVRIFYRLSEFFKYFFNSA